MIVATTAELVRALEEANGSRGAVEIVLGDRPADDPYRPRMEPSRGFGLLLARPEISLRAANPGRAHLDFGRLAYGIRIADRAHECRVDGLCLANAGKGILATYCDSLVLSRLKAWGMGAECLNTGYCDRLLIEDVEVWDVDPADRWVLPNAARDREGQVDPVTRRRRFYLHKKHGVYVASSFTTATLRRIHAHDLDGMGIHVNGTVGVGWARNVTIEDCLLERILLGAGVGAPALQFCATQGATVLRTIIRESNGGLTAHGEGNRRWRCQGIVVEDSELGRELGFSTNILDGSDVLFRRTLIQGRYLGSPPRIEVEPAPAPAPPAKRPCPTCGGAGEVAA